MIGRALVESPRQISWLKSLAVGGINLRPVFPPMLQSLIKECAGLPEAFSDAGYHLYLVGGVVRDAVINRLREDTDLDFTTDALPDEIEKIVGPWADDMWLQGKRFGTVAARKNGRLIEITTHRGEAYNEDSRKPEVVFSDSIETDLSRRDFTVNAMALRLPDLTLVDPFDGIVDLARQSLKTPSSPTISFSDDPLRMLRAARFIAQLSLAPTGDLSQAVREMSERLYFRTTRIWLKSVFASLIDLKDEVEIFDREIDGIVRAIGIGDLEAAALIRRAHVSMSFERMRKAVETRSPVTP